MDILYICVCFLSPHSPFIYECVVRLTPSFPKCFIEKREQYSMYFNKLV